MYLNDEAPSAIQQRPPKVYISCPKCLRVPFVQFSEKQKEKIQLKCVCNSYSEVQPIETYLKELSLSSSRNAKCEAHPNKKGKEFCVQCQQWLCVDCIASHNQFKSTKSHKKTKLGINNEAFCTVHPTKNNEYYCTKCKCHFCHQCLEAHNGHKIVKLDEFFTEKQMREIKEDFQNAVDLMGENMLIRDKLISQLQKQINRIEEAYDYSNRVNMNILNLIEILISNCSDSTPNYYMYCNVINNAKFNLRKCEIESDDYYELSYNINQLISYYQNYFINDDCEPFQKGFKKVEEIYEHKASVNCITKISDGRLCSCSDDASIKIYNCKKEFNVDINILNAHEEEINYLTELSPGVIISCCSGGEIKLWKIEGNLYKCMKTITDEHEEEEELEIYKAIPLKNDRFASCSSDKNIKIWKSTPPYKKIETLRGHNELVSNIVELKNEKDVLVSASDDDTICFWSLRNYTMIEVIKDIRCSYNNSIIEYDKNFLIVGGYNYITFINTNSFKVERFIKDYSLGSVRTLKLIDDEFLLCGCGNRTKGLLVVIKIDTGRIIYEKTDAHDEYISGISFLKGNTFATCSDDSEIKIWKF